MCDVESLFAFVMIPHWLEPTLVSPSAHYVRIMETRAWQDYLARSAARARQLIIYQWREQSISSKKSFQGYMELRRAFPMHHGWNHVRSAIVLLLAIWLLALFAPGQPLEGVGPEIGKLFLRLWKWVVGLGAVGIISRIPRVRTSLNTANAKMAQIEDWLLTWRGA
jgi:hypothetical protein